MNGIALLLGAAAAAHGLAHLLRLSPVPLMLAAGLVLARVGHVPTEFLEEALVLGVSFLLFITGIELSPRRTRGQLAAVLRVGALQFTLLGFCGVAAALLLGFSPLSATYIALALTASSTLIVVRLLRQRRQMFEPFGRLVTGVLLFQNLLIILLVPVVTRLPGGPAAVLRGTAAVAILFALAAAAARWLTPAFRRLDDDDEAMLLATLALLFAFIGLALLLDLPLPAGAFLAGVSLSGFPVSALARPQLASVSDFFSAIFFVALGALIGVPSFAEITHALLFAALVIGFTPPLVTIIAEWAGLSARPAIEAGLLLAQASELSLVVGLYGMTESQISSGVFTVIALATLLTMLTAPFIATDRVAWGLMHLHPTRPHPPTHLPARHHVLLLGSGSTGLPLLETLLAARCKVIVVDDDPDVVTRLRDAEVPVIRGDATDTRVLEQAHARSARIIVSTVRRPRDNRRVLEYARGVPVIVRVFDDDDALWVRAMGGSPVLYSEAAAAGLLQWFDRLPDPPTGSSA